MIVRDYSPGDGVTRYRFFNLEDEARRAARAGHRWDPDKAGYFSGDGQHTAFGLAKARAFVRSIRTGSRGIARTGRGPAVASETPLADRLERLEGIDVLGWLGEEGLSISVNNSEEKRLWAASVLAGNDGGIVFAKAGIKRPRRGYTLLRAASHPQDGLLLYALDPADEDGQDGSLVGQAEWLFHQNTKRGVAGSELVPLSHPLVKRLIG